jgi:glycosyl transferase family 2
VAARDRGPLLARCLDSLALQTLHDAEIIIADDNPQSLKLAIEQTRAPIVAVTNTHCIFPPDWLEKLCRAHDSEFAVIGGAVRHGGPKTLAAWACYLADYGAFQPSKPRHIAPVLAGNHISFKRPILDCLDDGYWKVFLLQDLSRRGVRLLFEPDLVVSAIQDAGFTNFARSYFRNARSFAAERSLRLSLSARLAHLAGVPLLPALLLYRRIHAVRVKDLSSGRLLATIPLLTLLILYWSAGELVGYLKRGAGTHRSC